jgi:hypothetical protein
LDRQGRQHQHRHGPRPHHAPQKDGELREFTCPPNTLLEGYSYLCSLGEYGCMANNLACCNQENSLPACPVDMLEPPRYAPTSDVMVNVCLNADIACILFNSICDSNPRSLLCTSDMAVLCPSSPPIVW